MANFAVRIAVAALLLPLAACASSVQPGPTGTSTGSVNASSAAVDPSKADSTAAAEPAGDAPNGVKARIVRFGKQCEQSGGVGYGCGPGGGRPLAGLEDVCREMAKTIPHFKVELSETRMSAMQAKDGDPWFWSLDCSQHHPVVLVGVLYDLYPDLDAWKRARERDPGPPRFEEDGPYLLAIYNDPPLAPQLQLFTPNHGNVIVAGEWLGSWEKTNKAMISVAKGAARFFSN